MSTVRIEQECHENVTRLAAARRRSSVCPRDGCTKRTPITIHLNTFVKTRTDAENETTARTDILKQIKFAFIII